MRSPWQLDKTGRIVLKHRHCATARAASQRPAMNAPGSITGNALIGGRHEVPLHTQRDGAAFGFCP